MRKILIVILLLILGSSICYKSIAQEIENGDREKIINYVNYFYTVRYVLNDDKTTDSDKKTVNNIIYTVDNAPEYNELSDILIKNNLGKTNSNLTKYLNERNDTIRDNQILEFIDKVVDIRGFEKFKLTKDDENELRRKIIKWYCPSKKESGYHKEDSGGHEKKTPSQSEGNISIWTWIVIAVCVIVVFSVVKNIYVSKEKNEYGNNNCSDFPAEREIPSKKEKKQPVENQKDLKTDACHTCQESDSIKVADINQSVENIGTSTTTPTIPVDIQYADVDVNDEFFVRTYEKPTKKTVYIIDVNRKTFALVEDEQLYEAKLSKVNTSGITKACEVRGSYKSGKSVSITPGNVQQEENGKWRIINKIIIEIR